jgi:hypothetical protein
MWVRIVYGIFDWVTTFNLSHAFRLCQLHFAGPRRGPANPRQSARHALHPHIDDGPLLHLGQPVLQPGVVLLAIQDLADLAPSPGQRLPVRTPRIQTAVWPPATGTDRRTDRVGAWIASSMSTPARPASTCRGRRRPRPSSSAAWPAPAICRRSAYTCSLSGALHPVVALGRSGRECAEPERRGRFPACLGSPPGTGRSPARSPTRAARLSGESAAARSDPEPLLHGLHGQSLPPEQSSKSG